MLANFEYRDVTSAVLQEPPMENLLITQLGLFNETIYSDSTSFLFDNIKPPKDVAASVVGNYDLGEYGSILTGSAETLMLRIPAYALESQITASAFQGKRKPGTDREKTLEEVTAEHLVSMKSRYELAHEAAMQQALFHNILKCKDGGDLNLVEEFGGKYLQSTDKLVVGGDHLRELERIVRRVKKQCGGLVHAFKGLYIFVDTATYDRLRYDDADLRRAIIFGNGGIRSKSILFDQEKLPGYSAFSIDGLPIELIACDEDFMVKGHAFAVPKMGKNAFLPIYTKLVGPATRNLKAAASGAPAEQLYWMSQTNECRKLQSESHVGFVNARPDLVFKLAIEEAPEL